MIKVGLIGCGMIAERGHLPAIQQTPGLVLEAMFDHRWERTLEMQKCFNAKHAYPKEEDFWKAVSMSLSFVHRHHSIWSMLPKLQNTASYFM